VEEILCQEKVETYTLKEKRRKKEKGEYEPMCAIY